MGFHDFSSFKGMPLSLTSFYKSADLSQVNNIFKRLICESKC